MIFSPTGTVWLIEDVIMDNLYRDTVDFDSLQAQNNYFVSRVFKTLDKYTYIRKDTSIRIDLNIEDLYSINYLTYRNSSTNKSIYCFITDKKYINDECTELVIETDIIQTYMFNYIFDYTFVEREHQNRWLGVQDPLLNIIEENLTLGDEYIKENDYHIAYTEGYFLVVASQQLENVGTYSAPNRVQHCPTPLYYYIIPNVETVCVMLSDDPSIVSMSMIPFLTFNYDNLQDVTYTNTEHNTSFTMKRISTDQQTRKVLGSVSKYDGMDLPLSFGVGHAKNYKNESKLLVYPYSYHTLTDYQGKPMIIKSEYLLHDDIEISIVQNISHEYKAKFYVSNGYKGEFDGKENCLFNTNINDLPLVTDVYKDYVQQHKASFTTGMAMAGANAVVSTVAGLMSSPFGLAQGVSAGMSALGQIAGELAKQKDLQNTPDTVRQMGNNISFDIADVNLGIRVCRLAIDPRIKQILGDYFAMYGYKCSSIKIPNLRSRYYYNYIKTIGCNLNGDMDNKDLAKLKTIYDTGITIWHDREGVTPLRYAYDNVEMILI
jgi:hypothetical protein